MMNEKIKTNVRIIIKMIIAVTIIMIEVTMV